MTLDDAHQMVRPGRLARGGRRPDPGGPMTTIEDLALPQTARIATTDACDREAAPAI